MWKQHLCDHSSWEKVELCEFVIVGKGLRLPNRCSGVFLNCAKKLVPSWDRRDWGQIQRVNSRGYTQSNFPRARWVENDPNQIGGLQGLLIPCQSGCPFILESTQAGKERKRVMKAESSGQCQPMCGCCSLRHGLTATVVLGLWPGLVIFSNQNNPVIVSSHHIRGYFKFMLFSHRIILCSV